MNSKRIGSWTIEVSSNEVIAYKPTDSKTYVARVNKGEIVTWNGNLMPPKNIIYAILGMI